MPGGNAVCHIRILSGVSRFEKLWLCRTYCSFAEPNVWTFGTAELRHQELVRRRLTSKRTAISCPRHVRCL
jgi:hypothetical protein